MINNKGKLDMLSIKELDGESFSIPDYQRGYRWTYKEVNKLLNDLLEFFSKETCGFYCLQPLVIYKNEKEKKWEVVDGQQRLTTIYLIINQLKKDINNYNVFKLSYKTRTDSENYLERSLSEKENKYKENIDFYNIYNAAKTIEEFFNEKENLRKLFVERIISENIKFILYDVTEDIKIKKFTAEEMFSRLNIGKIGLTNAELIKALFLNRVDKEFDKKYKSEKLKHEICEYKKTKISMQWDEIECTLQQNNFWSFIFGYENKENIKYATRIEFLFDILQNKNERREDDFFTFDKYCENLKDDNKKIDDIWNEVMDLFYTFKNWYEDIEFYHLIGLLRYLKVDIKEIINIKDKIEEDVFKKNFKKKLKDKILEKLKIDKQIEIDSLDFYKDKEDIKKLLVAFNVLSLYRYNQHEEKDKNNDDKNNEKEKKIDIRFSFSDFYGTKWDIEHVHSQTPKNMENKKDRKDWIITNLEYFSGLDLKDDKELINKIKENLQNLKEVEKEICKSLLELYENESEEIIKSSAYNKISEKFNLVESFNYENNISNLVLLDQGTNRGYKNAFFPVKRKWIFDRENKGIYILPCTKNVFSKVYSKKLFDLMNWTEYDAEQYLEQIKNILEIK